MNAEFYEPVSYEDLLLKIDEVVRLNNLINVMVDVEFRDSSLEAVDEMRVKSVFKTPKSWRRIRGVLKRYRISDFTITFPGKARIILKYGDELIINVY